MVSLPGSTSTISSVAASCLSAVAALSLEELLLEEELELINELGFGLEPFGEGTFMLRAVPEGLDAPEALAALDELASSLLSSRRPDKAAARDELLKTVACKAAIKAGRSSAREELQRLAEAVCSGRVRYCPHGRPVSWSLTRRELDKQFRRIL